MSGVFESIGGFILHYPAWSHVILAAGILLQGELTVLVAVYLIVSGDFSWFSFIASSLIGLFIGENVVYFMGRTVRHTRFGWKLYKKYKANRRIQTYTYYLKTNLTKLFIIAKFLLGINLPILLLTGWARTKYRAFLKAHFVSSFAWFFPITVISYLFATGLYYLRAAKIFREVEIGIAVVFLIIFGLEYLFRKFLRRKELVPKKAGALGALMQEKLEPFPRKDASGENEMK